MFRLRTLNRDFKQKLVQGLFSEEELKQIQEQMKAENKTELWISLGATILLLILVVIVAVVPEFKNGVSGSAIGNSIAWILLSFAIGGVMAFGTFGLITIQFNSALKKGYSELAAKYKL